MARLIDKDALVAEIEGERKFYLDKEEYDFGWNNALDKILSFLDTLEVIDPYEQIVQHSSIKDGIQAHAETYSFNIESELFNQLTKEQQALWRKEIEQACISGGEVGVELTRDIRYKENLEVKEVDLEKEIKEQTDIYYNMCEEKLKEMSDDDTDLSFLTLDSYAKHFFELGLKTQKGE